MSWLRIRLVAIGLCGLTLGGATVASEWTFWRGPAGDGVSDETGLISSWSPEGENLVWMAEFTGRSTPVVVDGRVCANAWSVDNRKADLDRQCNRGIDWIRTPPVARFTRRRLDSNNRCLGIRHPQGYREKPDQQ